MFGDLIPLIDGIDRVGLPIVLGLVFVIMAFKLYPYVVDYFKACAEKKRDEGRAMVITAEENGRYSEQLNYASKAIDNSASAINNSTEAIMMVRENHKQLKNVFYETKDTIICEIRDHETASKDRDIRNEQKNDDIRANIGKCRGDLAEIRTMLELK